MSETETHFAYVVVGGGSAGCIAAARLAESGARVLLLEAGDSAQANPETLSADGFKDAFAKEATLWHRMSRSQDGCGKRRLFAGSGRGLGGSGAVNGMVYTRGDRADYSRWPRGWRWEDLSADFQRLETHLGIRSRPPTDFVQRFIDAGLRIGLRHKDGMNDGDLHQVIGCNAMNFSGDDRRSSYRAWLHDAPPASLDIRCNAQATRIIFDEHRRAVAVEYTDAAGQQRAHIGQELILCAGALETPRLLMLSGAGPADQLQALGITPVLNSPDIGEHLQDHPNVCLFYRAGQRVDFNYPQTYAFTEAGNSNSPSTSGASNTCLVCYAAPASLKHSMLRMLPVLALPGRLHAITPLRKLLRGLIHMAFALPPLKAWVSRLFGIVVILGKPRSRGRIRLRSREPDVPADIDLAYFQDEEDRRLIRAGIAQARSLAEQMGDDIRPLSAGARELSPDRQWRWIEQAAMTTFHYCGSCRMGELDSDPVDPELRLRGTPNVRVADASVIPEIPVSAINAPSMLIGYRVADFILRSHSTRPGVAA